LAVATFEMEGDGGRPRLVTGFGQFLADLDDLVLELNRYPVR
jgi:hypothetical protein